jgi:hypothetical protein
MLKNSVQFRRVLFIGVFSYVGCGFGNSITDLFQDYIAALKDKKFTVTAGLISQKFTVPDSDFHGYSQNKVVSVNYKWSPSIESNALFLQGKTYVHNRAETIHTISANNTWGAGFKYVLSEYFNIVASFTQSKVIAYRNIRLNANALSEKSWTTNRTPTVSLNYLYPIASSVYSLFRVGASHSFQVNHAYVNSQGVFVEKTNAENTKGNLGATVMYTGYPLVVPLIKTTYINTLNSTKNMKSRHAYSVGGGAALLGGLLSISYAVGRYNKSIKTQELNLAGTIKF